MKRKFNNDRTDVHGEGAYDRSQSVVAVDLIPKVDLKVKVECRFTNNDFFLFPEISMFALPTCGIFNIALATSYSSICRRNESL